MNIDALLSPLSETSPCGDDLSFSTEFDVIQELRRADDATLDQGEWVTAFKLADWPGVIAQCSQLLTRRTKDLRVAVWLADAHARVNGYAGLADGLTLCRLLCERFWSELHPLLDDGDAEQRSGNLRWLLAQVEDQAKRLPVLQQGARSFSLHDVEAARKMAARSVSPDESAGAAPLVTLDDIAAARHATPREFFISNLEHVRRAGQALRDLQTLIDARLGSDGPGFSTAKSALDEVTQTIESFAREENARHGTASPSGATSTSALVSDAEPADHVASNGRLLTRADALGQLRAVAQFFRRTEPHSPVAYLAERAAQWGEMPLHAWLRAVVKDAGSLSQMEELLGVLPAPGSAE